MNPFTKTFRDMASRDQLVRQVESLVAKVIPDYAHFKPGDEVPEAADQSIAQFDRLRHKLREALGI